MNVISHHLQVEVLRRPVDFAQYTSIKFTEHLALEGIAPSVGSVGDAFDNALMEIVIGLYKTECIARPRLFGGGPFRTISDVEFVTMAWVDCYNNRRLRGSIGHVPPPSTKPRTTPDTLPTNRRGNPYESGTKPVTVYSGGERRTAAP